MRSASLSFVKQAVKEKRKPTTRLNKHIKDAKKSVAAGYLQLKSKHAFTGVHLLKTKKVQDARYWWYGDSRQTVVYLMLECWKWRRERDIELKNDEVFGRLNYPHALSHNLSERTVYIPSASLCCYDQYRAIAPSDHGVLVAKSLTKDLLLAVIQQRLPGMSNIINWCTLHVASNLTYTKVLARSPVFALAYL
jgi:hypothetical protein